jgi:hypothetical protein
MQIVEVVGRSRIRGGSRVVVVLAGHWQCGFSIGVLRWAFDFLAGGRGSDPPPWAEAC